MSLQRWQGANKCRPISYAANEAPAENLILPAISGQEEAMLKQAGYWSATGEQPPVALQPSAATTPAKNGEAETGTTKGPGFPWASFH